MYDDAPPHCGTLLLALMTFRVPTHLVTRHLPFTQPLFLTFMLNFSVPDALAEPLHAYFLPARALYNVLPARESLYCPCPFTVALVLHVFFVQRFWKLQADTSACDQESQFERLQPMPQTRFESPPQLVLKCVVLLRQVTGRATLLTLFRSHPNPRGC